MTGPENTPLNEPILTLFNESIGVTWYSAWSPDFANQAQVEARWTDRRRFIRFSEQLQMETRIFTDDWVVRQASITFEDADGQIVASAWLPAFAPRDSEELLPDPAVQRQPQEDGS